jgi:hypothetical protein
MNKKNCKLEYPSIDEDEKKEFLNDFFSAFSNLKSHTLQLEAENKRRFFETAPKNKVNKEIALTHETVRIVKNRASQVTSENKLSQSEKKVWQLILAANQLAQGIQSCDLPSDSADNIALVKLTQNFADTTLNNERKTWLQKILEIALYT